MGVVEGQAAGGRGGNAKLIPGRSDWELEVGAFG